MRLNNSPSPPSFPALSFRGDCFTLSTGHPSLVGKLIRSDVHRYVQTATSPNNDLSGQNGRSVAGMDQSIRRLPSGWTILDNLAIGQLSCQGITVSARLENRCSRDRSPFPAVRRQA